VKKDEGSRLEKPLIPSQLTDVQSKVRRSYVKYPGDHSPCRTHTHTHIHTHTHTWWFWSPRLSSPSLSAQCTAELAKLNTKEARLCSCDARPASGDLHLSLCVRVFAYVNQGTAENSGRRSEGEEERK